MGQNMQHLIDIRDDKQSQLDALMGECPEVCARLEREIESLNRSIEGVE